MLSRILEPEAMDTAEEALAYDSMDHSVVNRAFVDDFLAAFGGERLDPMAGNEGAFADAALPPPIDVLDLGTGTAQIPVLLCRTDARFRVVAVDLAPSMLYLAQAKIDVAGLTERIRLDLIDAKTLPYADGQFAAVISNSIVHHIAEPQTALAEAWRVLAPGGTLFFRDLLRPADEAEWRTLVSTYAADCTEHQRRLFSDSLRAALSLDEMRCLAEQVAGASTGVTRSSDRHWTWTAYKK